MSQYQSNLHIPSHEDPVERRRVLNILAQRRYRKKRREEVLMRSDKTQSLPDDGSLKEIRNPSQEGIGPDVEDGMVESAFQPAHDLCDFQADGLLAPVFETSDVSFARLEGTASDPYTDKAVGQELSENPDCNADNLSWLSSFENVPELRQRPSQSNSEFTDGASLSQLVPDSASAFADYVITTPGLSVIRAKVDIFDSIIGSAFSLDIWDPTTISPVCLGINTKPCPANFAPSHLQRSVPHHPIVDVLPWPSFRDRFLYTMTLPVRLRPGVAQEDMANVTLQLMMAIKDAAGGLRVWGANAYSQDSWEIGQTFFSKFWWALDASIVRRSNEYRALRGESHLRYLAAALA